jgi:hypothetical protein
VRRTQSSHRMSQSVLEPSRVRYQGHTDLRKELPVIYADHDPARLALLVLSFLVELAWIASLL